MKARFLSEFKLYLNDKTIIFHDVNVINTNDGIRIIGNPLTISIRPIKIIGLSAFDEDGIIGHVVRLPKFMWRMLRKKPKHPKAFD